MPSAPSSPQVAAFKLAATAQQQTAGRATEGDRQQAEAARRAASGAVAAEALSAVALGNERREARDEIARLRDELTAAVTELATARTAKAEAESVAAVAAAAEEEATARTMAGRQAAERQASQSAKHTAQVEAEAEAARAELSEVKLLLLPSLLSRPLPASPCAPNRSDSHCLCATCSPAAGGGQARAVRGGKGRGACRRAALCRSRRSRGGGGSGGDSVGGVYCGDVGFQSARGNGEGAPPEPSHSNLCGWWWIHGGTDTPRPFVGTGTGTVAGRRRGEAGERGGEGAG